MPVDADGNRADIVMDAGSTVSRMNLGRLYEHYIGGACRDTQKRIKAMLGLNGISDHLNDRVMDICTSDSVLFNNSYDYLMGFYKICSPKQWTHFTGASAQDRLNHLASIVTDGIYLYMPTDNEPESVAIIQQLEKDYRPCYGPVTYGVGDHPKVLTEANVRVAPLYMLLLEKIGDEWSSVSSAKLHHFGILATHTKSDKYNKPYRHTPVRTIGETEGRIYVSYCGREAAGEMMDRSNSPTTHRKVVESILSADKPTNINYAVDRKRVPLGNCKALQLVKHSLLCFGVKMVYRKK